MSMRDYLGFPQLKNEEPGMQRALPQVNIAGTLFYADIYRQEFRQVDNAGNRITMGNVREEMGFSHFLYDTRTKNLYLENIEKTSAIPEYVRIIIVPPLKQMDPEGLAMRQGNRIAKHIERPALKLIEMGSKRQKPSKTKRF